ncbi:MAG: hypothetical protein ACYCS4_12975 [Acidimicrobiales bacterium]
MPSSIQSTLATIEYVGLLVMVGAFVAGAATIGIARSRGYLGLGSAGTRRVLAALLGIFAIAMLPVLIGLFVNQL